MNAEQNHTLQLRLAAIHKIVQEWDEKWMDFGREFLGHQKLKKKNKFYTVIQEDIDQSIEKRYGKEIPFDMIISKDTVRRFLDLNFQKSFDDKTRNAFAVYLNFDSWEDYVQTQFQVTLPQTVNHYHITTLFPVIRYNMLQDPLQLEPPKRKYYWKYIFVALFVFLSLFVGFYGYGNWQKNRIFTEDEKAKVSLKLIRRSHDFNPCMADFSYDFSSLSIDSAIVYFGGQTGVLDEAFQVLKEPRGTFNFVFYKPGIWPIQIKYGKQILTETTIQIKSDGWAVWTTQFGNGDRSRLYPKRDYYVDGALYLHPEKLALPEDRINYGCEYTLVKDFGVDVNQMAVEFRTKNSPDEYGLSCYDTGFHLISDNQFDLSVTFRRKGCTFDFTDYNLDYNLISFNRQYLFEEWTSVRIELKNGKGLIFLDSKAFSDFEYPAEDVTKLRGLLFNTKGSGKLDDVKVFDENNKLVYADDFDVVPKSTIGGY